MEQHNNRALLADSHGVRQHMEAPPLIIVCVLQLEITSLLHCLEKRIGTLDLDKWF